MHAEKQRPGQRSPREWNADGVGFFLARFEFARATNSVYPATHSVGSPSPLWGGVGGGGPENLLRSRHLNATAPPPPLAPPPQGGRGTDRVCGGSSAPPQPTIASSGTCRRACPDRSRRSSRPS